MLEMQQMQAVPPLEHYAERAGLAVVLLLALVVVLAILWRRLDLSRETLWRAAQRLWSACRDSAVVRHLRERYPRAWAFAAARVTPGQYLGLHLTVGLLVSLLGLWGFAGITEDVVTHEPLTQFDLALQSWFRAHATPMGDRVFVVISLLGSPVAMAGLALAGAAWLAWRRRWLLLGGWAAAFGGAGVLAWGLKLAVRRPRPVGAAAFLHGATFSFPSGHALGSLIGFGVLAYLLMTYGARRNGAQLAIVAAAAALVLAIGVSRLYLGVHYFSDVVGGFAAGVLWLAACVSGLEVARRRPVETRRA
jgi:membrane-associated phospholipid phosphatase